jgi:predicted ABC-type ATPase
MKGLFKGGFDGSKTGSSIDFALGQRYHAGKTDSAVSDSDRPGADSGRDRKVASNFEGARLSVLISRVFKSGEWEEVKHPRAPAGSSEGGQFISVDNLADFFERLSKPDGGFSYQPILDTEAVSGFVVSIYKNSVVKPVAELRLDDLTDFATKKENNDLLKDTRNYYGGWHDPETGNIFLDITINVDTAEEAQALSKKHDQIAYFDVKSGKSVLVDRKATSGGVVKMDFHHIFKRFDPDQPRAPAGSDFGGQWVSTASLEGFPASSLVENQTVYTKDEMKNLEDSYLRSSPLSEAEQELFKSRVEEMNRDLASGNSSKHLNTNEPGGRGGYTRERLKIHEDILTNLISNSDFAKPGSGETKQLYILGGKGGSGKSKFGTNEDTDLKLYDSSKALVIDADMFKAELAKRDGVAVKDSTGNWSVGHRAAVYHEESGDLFDKAVIAARDKGLNVVMDVTLNSAHHHRVDLFKKQGYEVTGLYMYLPKEEAAKRAINRAWDNGSMNGRMVPPAIVLKSSNNEKSFDSLLVKFDKAVVYRNDVPRGTRPRKVWPKDSDIWTNPKSRKSDILKFDSDQPRAPSGVSEGGQWVSGAVSSLSKAVEEDVSRVGKVKDGVSAADLVDRLTQEHGEALKNVIDRIAPDKRPMVLLHKGDAAKGIPTVWLLGWDQTKETDIHDHAESEVGISVVRGSVAETIYEWDRSKVEQAKKEGVDFTIHTQKLQEGAKLSVPAHYIHEVGGIAESTVKDVTLHAYYPPLKKMGYFKIEGSKLKWDGDWDEDRIPSEQDKIRKCGLIRHRQDFSGIFKFDADQLRAPAGTPDGGQWISGSGHSSSVPAKDTREYSNFGVFNTETTAVVQEFIDRHDRVIETKLNDDEKDAVNYYTDKGFRPINKYLGDGKLEAPAPKEGELSLGKKDSVIERNIGILDSALDKSVLGADVKLHRGMAARHMLRQFGMLPANYDGFGFIDMEDVDTKPLIGRVYEEKAFASGSLKPDDFSLQNSVNKIFLEINAKKESKGLYVASISENPHEREVLLPRNSRFMVRGVKNRNNISITLAVDLL